MNDKTINLAPAEWKRLQPRSPIPSMILTGVAALALLIPTFAFQSELAEAEPSTPPAEILESWVRVPSTSPLLGSLERLEAWYPWDEILVEVAQGLGPEDALQYCAYSAEQQTFEVAGSVARVVTVQDLVEELRQWTFLRNMNPFKVESNGTRTQFGVRLDVHPALRREKP